MNACLPFPDARLFEHEAMHTTFSLRLRGMAEADARDIAKLSFDLLDSLEARLSRFIEDSEISRINRMHAGETLYLSEATHQCLLLALDAYLRTGGLFDITLGARIEHAKSGGATPAPDLRGRLIIHPDVPAVTCEEPGRELDLGGIGKGFALDQLHALLGEWGAQDALLSAGASSMLAFGPTAWPADLAGAETRRIQLANRSLSASGTGIQGAHIIHPAGTGSMPADSSTRVWVLAPTAAMAEVWSTALMLVPPAEIPDLISNEPLIREVHIEVDGALRTFNL